MFLAPDPRFLAVRTPDPGVLVVDLLDPDPQDPKKWVRTLKSGSGAKKVTF